MALRRNWYCDLCVGRDGQEVRATRRRVPVRVGDLPGRTLDLCERHYDALLQPVVVVLEEFGADPVSGERRRDSNRHRRGAGPFRCLVRGCKATPLKHRGTLWQHVRGVHEITLEEYCEWYGEPVPLTVEEQAALVVEVRCPVAGCDKVYSTAEGYRWPQQALVSHTWGVHGIKARQLA